MSGADKTFALACFLPLGVGVRVQPPPVVACHLYRIRQSKRTEPVNHHAMFHCPHHRAEKCGQCVQVVPAFVHALHRHRASQLWGCVPLIPWGSEMPCNAHSLSARCNHPDVYLAAAACIETAIRRMYVHGGLSRKRNDEHLIDLGR
jgi:hypothetical protein